MLNVTSIHFHFDGPRSVTFPPPYYINDLPYFGKGGGEYWSSKYFYVLIKTVQQLKSQIYISKTDRVHHLVEMKCVFTLSFDSRQETSPAKIYLERSFSITLSALEILVLSDLVT